MAVLTGIVDLANELDVGIGRLDLMGGIGPELGRHHLGHVATEGVDMLGGPEEQDVEHLLPRAWHGVEVAYATGKIVDAVVQLHRLVPVVTSGTVVEMVVAGGFGRLLDIGLRLAVIQIKVG